MARGLQKMLRNLGIARNVLNYGEAELAAYVEQKIIAEEVWCKNFPIIQCHLDKLRMMIAGKKTKLPEISKKTVMAGADLECDMYYKPKSTNQEAWDRLFGKDIAFSMASREITLCPECPKSYETFLFDKYGLTQSAIIAIENNLKSATFDSYDTSLLEVAYEHNETYINNLNHTVKLDVKEVNRLYTNNLEEIPEYFRVESTEHAEYTSNNTNWDSLRLAIYILYHLGYYDGTLTNYKLIISDLLNKDMIIAVPSLNPDNELNDCIKANTLSSENMMVWLEDHKEKYVIYGPTAIEYEATHPKHKLKIEITGNHLRPGVITITEAQVEDILDCADREIVSQPQQIIEEEEKMDYHDKIDEAEFKILFAEFNRDAEADEENFKRQDYKDEDIEQLEEEELDFLDNSYTSLNYYNIEDFPSAHDHECKYCKMKYRHTHKHTKSNHDQLDYQCPYPECESYFGAAGDTQYQYTHEYNADNPTFAIKLNNWRVNTQF
jgi:hypothetical protein